MSAKDWIQRLQMNEHPEGGWYVESFRDEREIDKRSASTAIYFLLERGVPSHFHKIASAELWHFYSGAPLIVHELRGNTYIQHRIGPNWEQGERFQISVPAHSWFAAETQGAFSLVGCTVAPGFSFEDFVLAKRDELTAIYPDKKSLIERLTRD